MKYAFHERKKLVLRSKNQIINLNIYICIMYIIFIL